MTDILKKQPIFLYLLSLFFVLHGFSENYDTVLAKDALTLLLKYLAFAGFATLLFWLLYKNFTKASLIVFLLMAYNFFFGTVHDFLSPFIGNTFLLKYSFLLPARPAAR